MFVIGVSGQLRQGKDIVADYLSLQLDGHRTAFAAAVKEVFCQAFSVDLNFVEEWKVKDEPPPGFDANIRTGLQMIGDGFRKLKSTIWLDRCFEDFDFLDCPIIISDTRYVNELKKVHEVGGTNILVYRPGFFNNDPNGSEAQIKPFVQYFLDTGGFEGIVHKGYLTNPPELVDIFIRNDGTLEDLYSKIDEIVIPYLEEKYDISHHCGKCAKKITGLFCSKSCSVKARPRKDSRQTFICQICHKEFLSYGQRVVCGQKCNAILMAQTRIGENNPAFKQDKPIAICKNCGYQFEYSMCGRKDPPQYCTKECWDKFQKGKNKALDGPAIYGNPYPSDFHKIKKSVRKRDEYSCCLCGYKSRSISVHHIDYNKSNNELWNLISMCKRCHNLTNFNRGFWQFLLTGLISGSKLVKKGWGAEIHLVNHDKYCLKYLIFFEGKRFSYHFHEVKQELWHCAFGQFDLLLDGVKTTFIAGQKLELLPNQKHELRARKNSALIEVSTTDYPEDSIRIWKGD